MRIFAISDIHVDFKENRTWVAQLSGTAFCNDALILAGDVSHRLDRLEDALGVLTDKFARVFFVPGNHDLWVHPKDGIDSLEKLTCVLGVCKSLGVQTTPGFFGGVWVVPLFSWYEKPEVGPDSLFVPKAGENPSLKNWKDSRLIVWPGHAGSIAGYMADLNRPHLVRRDMPVITFSHFLPRCELMFSDPKDRVRVSPGARDAHPTFNFSRVAGTAALDRQVRAVGAQIHVYGHQHRNRRRCLNGVTYISHCLGYRRERQWGFVCRPGEGPAKVWPKP